MPPVDSAPLTAPGPITVSFNRMGGLKETQSYDLLIVACDPRHLKLDVDAAEKAVFSALQNFRIHCTILEVTNPPTPVPYGIVLAPGVVEKMDGSIYGFRNETAKQYDLVTARGMEKNLVAVYQLYDPWKIAGNPEYPPDWFRTKLATELKKLPGLKWWPYGPDVNVITDYTTDYFDHFSAEDVGKGLPWTYLDLQGQRNTYYVHASTCFESALHCWQYAKMLFEPNSGLHHHLPFDPAARILITGAGVSGLLFAEKLFRQDYKNVTVMEALPDQSGRGEIYGKTQTLTLAKPRPDRFAPHAVEPTVAELGTCYMSVAYKPMLDHLQRYYLSDGNDPTRTFMVGDPTQLDFRGMVCPDDMPGCGGKVLGFTDYVIARARQFLGPEYAEYTDWEIEAKILEAAICYFAERAACFGSIGLMALDPPPDTLTVLEMNFQEFLVSKGMGALVGVMEYSYSIQGYGSLTSISTFYGMTWISDALVVEMLLEEGLKHPLITFWSKGWGDVWARMVDAITQNGQVRIEYGINITEINRPV